MNFVRSIAFTIPGARNKPSVEISVIEDDGKLIFEVRVNDPQGKVADLRGLFFDLNDPAKLAGLSYTGGAGLITDFDTVDVIDLGNGANMHGAASPFDVGFEFGAAGIGKDKGVVNAVSFTLTNAAGNLTLDDIANTEFGARLTSGGGAKLTTIAPAAPDANADAYGIFEDGQSGLSAPSATSAGVLFAVLANDTDADGDTLTVTHVVGAAHGTLQIVDGDDADTIVGDAILYTPTADYAGPDSFTYAISDNNGGTDFATVDVAIEAVADIPLLDVVVSAGDAANKLLVTVTATQTDDDSSEYIDRIVLSGVPATVLVTPLGVDPVGEPDQLVQVFELTLPDDADTDFTLAITAVAKETSNGDEQTAISTVEVELNYTLSQLTATFEATDQSIWSTGDQFTFTDDRFLGVDTSWNESGGGFVYGATDGYLKAGFQSTLVFEGGEIDATVEYDIDVETLYNKTTDVLFLTADAVLSDTFFSTEGPEGSYALDFIFQFLLNASAGIDIEVDSYELLDFTIGPFNESFSILDVDSEDIAFNIALPAGFSLDFAWPNIDTVSNPLSGNAASSNGASNNFFGIGLDVDELIFTLLGLPNPFDIGVDFAVGSASLEIADLDLNAGLNFIQNFLLTVNSLAGSILFEDGSSQAFDFDTDILLSNASTRDLNNDGSIAYTLTLSPDVDLLNDTDLGINFGFVFDVLKVSGEYDILVDSDTFQLGPLFSVEDTFDLATIDVYSDTFDVDFGAEQFFLLA